jgi:hypothetical protein
LYGWGEIRYAYTPTNVREARTTKSKVIAKLYKGDRVKVDFERNDWFAVFDETEENRLESNEIGYVYAPLLKLTPPYDFRECRWGMSIKEVKNREKKRLEEFDLDFLNMKGEGYLCTDKIAGLEGLVMYGIYKNKLVRGGYWFDISKETPEVYIRNYQRLKDLLLNLYGPPYTYIDSTGKEMTMDLELWHNNKYRNEPQKWDLALKLGHLEYNTFWETHNTGIRLKLCGGNNSKKLMIVYESLRMQKMLKEFLEDYKKPYLDN